MPIYEYQCEDCERQIEVMQRVDEPPLAECPHCGGPVRKLISAPAFQFKGSGWYVTDYARKGQAEGGETAGASESSNGKADTSEASTSAKAEPKTEKKKTEKKTSGSAEASST